MPELPEVETLRLELESLLLGQKIKAVQVNDQKTIKPLSLRLFRKSIIGKKITKLNRRAKILIIELGDNNYLLVHLKMTGQLIFKKNQNQFIAGGHPEPKGLLDLPNKFTRLIFTFSNNQKLFFNDSRRFGWVRYVDADDKIKNLNHLGLEPLTSNFNTRWLRQQFKKTPRKKVKVFLLDQTKIAGLGNIYVDESLFIAGIRPTRSIGQITKNETEQLVTAIKKILRQSIKKGGTSFRDFKRANGQAGNFISCLKVYGQDKKPCRVCGQMIKKIKLAGRGTHFCPHCQR